MRVATPQDLMEALSRDDFGTVADIARASGVNYQRLLRWSNGSSTAVAQDDMADLVKALGREPEEYGVQPSLAWKQKNVSTPPPWAVELGRKLDEVLRRLDHLEHR